MWRVAANILSSSGRPTRVVLPAWGLGEVLTAPRRKTLRRYRTLKIRLKSGSACCYSVKNCLLSSLLSKI